MGEEGNAHRSPTNEEGIAECLGPLLATACGLERELRQRAAKALIDGDDTRAQGYLAAVEQAKQGTQKLRAAYDFWKDRRPRPPTGPTRRGRCRLRVDLNGKLIEYPTTAETFARTIEQIGIEKVMRLGKVLSGIPLIGRSKASDYQNQFRIGGFYVCTHSNTKTKARILKEVGEELGVRLRVEVVAER